MFLVKLSNNVLKKRSRLSPFFLFFKKKKFSKVNRGLLNSEKTMRLKKSCKLDFHISPKTNRHSYSIYSDNNTLSVVEGSTGVRTGTTNRHCYFNTEDLSALQTAFLFYSYS